MARPPSDETPNIGDILASIRKVVAEERAARSSGPDTESGPEQAGDTPPAAVPPAEPDDAAGRRYRNVFDSWRGDDDLRPGSMMSAPGAIPIGEDDEDPPAPEPAPPAERVLNTGPEPRTDSDPEDHAPPREEHSVFTATGFSHTANPNAPDSARPATPPPPPEPASETEPEAEPEPELEPLVLRTVDRAASDAPEPEPELESATPDPEAREDETPEEERTLITPPPLVLSSNWRISQTDSAVGANADTAPSEPEPADDPPMVLTANLHADAAPPPEPEQEPEPEPPETDLSDLEEAVRRVIRSELSGALGDQLATSIRRIARDEIAREKGGKVLADDS